MARYRDVPDKLKIASERIEPTLAYIMGRWWAQAEHMRETYGQGSQEHADALETLWYGLERMSSLVGLCIDTHHAAVAIGNHIRETHKVVEALIGYAPPFDTDKCEAFRRVAQQHTCEACGSAMLYYRYEGRWGCPACRKQKQEGR